MEQPTDKVWKGENIVVKKRGGGERLIPWDKWYWSGSRAMGSSRDRVERKPHHGFKIIHESDIIRKEDVWQKAT